MINRVFKECNRTECCEVPTRKKSIVLDDEPSVSLNIDNNKGWSVYKVRVDGCMISAQNTSTKRCDWLLYRGGNVEGTLLLVELKSRKLPETIVGQFTGTVNYINQLTDNALESPSKIKQKNILVYKINRSGMQMLRELAEGEGVSITFLPCYHEENSVDVSIEGIFKVN